MKYILLMAVIGILLLYWSDSIPLSSVGGPMAIAMAFLIGALAVAIHEAWTMRRGVLGWIVNIVVSLAGAFIAAQAGSMLIAIPLSAVNPGGSLAATGGPLMAIALAGTMVVTLLGSWGALQLVNRWR